MTSPNQKQKNVWRGTSEPPGLGTKRQNVVSPSSSTSPTTHKTTSNEYMEEGE